MKTNYYECPSGLLVRARHTTQVCTRGGHAGIEECVMSSKPYIAPVEHKLYPFSTHVQCSTASQPLRTHLQQPLPFLLPSSVGSICRCSSFLACHRAITGTWIYHNTPSSAGSAWGDHNCARPPRMSWAVLRWCMSSACIEWCATNRIPRWIASGVSGGKGWQGTHRVPRWIASCVSGGRWPAAATCGMSAPVAQATHVHATEPRPSDSPASRHCQEPPM